MQLGGSGTGASYNPGVPRTYKTPTKAYGVSAPPKSAPAPYHAPTPPRQSSPAPYRAPAPRVVSGKSVGSNSLGQITPIAPAKPAAPVHQWSANEDVTYQQQEAAAHKSLQDYVTGQNTAQNQYNIENTRNDKNLVDQEKVSHTNMADDYASRGMSTSGLALKAFMDQALEYKKQQSVLDQGARNFGTTAKSQLGNFKSTQAINDTKYKNDAINRHASSFGLI